MILLKIYFMIKDPSDMNGVQIQAYGTTQDYYCIVIVIVILNGVDISPKGFVIAFSTI